jgi:Family of unknown function (DUF6228)
MGTLRLESSRDGGVFELDQGHGKNWQASLTLPGLRAATDVDGSGYGFGEGLSTYFRRIADDWRGWDGPRGWSSLEGEFDFQATHDGLGHVELRVRMRGGLDADDWQAEGTIWIDAGQLETLARAARSFDSSAGLAATE